MFSLPRFDSSDLGHECAGWPLAIEFMDSLDIRRLARDKTYRSLIAGGSAQEWNQVRMQLLANGELEEKAARADEQLVTELETRGLLHKAWSCVF